LEAITYGKMLIVVTNSSLQASYVLLQLMNAIQRYKIERNFAINDLNNFVRVLGNLFDFDP